MLIWNDRQADAAGVFSAYEKLINEFRTDNLAETHRVVLRAEAGELAAFFAPQPMQRRMVPGVAQDFDFEGLKGRLLSSSYAPPPGHSWHAAMIAELQRVFDEHQRGGRVRFEHCTEICFGRLGE